MRISPILKQMNRLIQLIVGAVLLASTSCSYKKNYTINATLEHLDGQPVYVVQELFNEGFSTDTIHPDNNTFLLQRPSDSLSAVYLYFNDKTEPIRFYLKNGDRLTLTGDANDLFGMQVKGNQINEEISEFRRENRTILVQLAEKERNIAAQWETPDYGREIDALKDSLYKKTVSFIEEHPESPASTILMYEYLLDENNAALCDSLLKILPVEARPLKLQTKIEVILSRISKNKPGTIFPYFSLQNHKDSTVHSSSFRGKPTVITCWAANDSLSLQEFRFQKEWYKNIDSKEVNLVSISFDMDTALWKNRIRTDSLPGKHVRLPEGWNSPWVKNNAIIQLPSTFVLDKQGKIKAHNLKGYALKEYIEEIVAREDSIRQAGKR